MALSRLSRWMIHVNFITTLRMHGSKETCESKVKVKFERSVFRAPSFLFYDLSRVPDFIYCQGEPWRVALTYVKLIFVLHYLPRVWMEYFIGLLSVMQRLICREEEDALFYLTQGKAKACPPLLCVSIVVLHLLIGSTLRRECVDHIRDSPDQPR